MNKVKFMDHISIFYFIDDAYNCREKYCEFFYYDRLRFKEKIKTMEKILGPILYKRIVH